MDEGARRRELGVVAVVRCLGCGTAYPKPNGGGTFRENPGCPECGYVGWVAVTREDDELLHSAAGQPQRRSA
jgi:predicted  nucleic acid-binding Zn-ribbon protein